MSDTVYCPRCGSLVIKEEEEDSHLARCTVCFFAFCTLCNRSWHQVSIQATNRNWSITCIVSTKAKTEYILFQLFALLGVVMQKGGSTSMDITYLYCTKRHCLLLHYNYYTENITELPSSQRPEAHNMTVSNTQKMFFLLRVRTVNLMKTCQLRCKIKTEKALVREKKKNMMKLFERWKKKSKQRWN